MTARADVTELYRFSKETGTKLCLDFLYVLAKALNSCDDCRMGRLRQTKELICCDVIHPTQYVFHEDTGICSPVCTTYYEDPDLFRLNAAQDPERAKQSREYAPDMANHPNRFDASYAPGSPAIRSISSFRTGTCSLCRS